MKIKLLILIMSCEDPFFLNEERLVMETWLKDVIDGKYKNIEYLFYRGNSNKDYLDENNVYHIRVEDDIKNTFKKTWCVFRYLSSNVFKDDTYYYVFRTNTSTYVNIPLLYEFIKSLNVKEDYNTLWCSELYSLSEVYAPFPLYLCGRGNGLLLSQFLVSTIVFKGYNLLYLNLTDDIGIGNVLNSCNMNIDLHNPDIYLNYIKSFKHGWYKSISVLTNNNHSLCQYHNENGDFNFLKQFITIQVKRYHEREKEESIYLELHEKMKGKVDTDIKNTVKEQYQYSKNPNIFIGSILGYISLNEWKLIDKRELFKIQVNNKSIDDENRGKQLNTVLL